MISISSDLPISYWVSYGELELIEAVIVSVLLGDCAPDLLEDVEFYFDEKKLERLVLDTIC